MATEYPALRLTVVVSESDRYHHGPLYTEVVHRAHASGLAGATVTRGVEGYGATARLHTARLLSLGDELPVVVTVVDSEPAVRAFVAQLDGLVTGGLVTLEPVTLVRFGPRA